MNYSAYRFFHVSKSELSLDASGYQPLCCVNSQKAGPTTKLQAPYMVFHYFQPAALIQPLTETKGCPPHYLGNAHFELGILILHLLYL